MEKINNPEQVLELMANLQAERLTLSEAMEKLKAENERLKDDKNSGLEEKKEEIEKLLSSKKELENRLNNMSSQVGAKDKRIKELTDTNNSLAHRNGQLAAENENLRATKQTPDTSIDEKEIEKLKQDLENATKGRDTVRSENNELKSNKAQLLEQVKNLSAEKSNLEEQLKKVKADATQHETVKPSQEDRTRFTAELNNANKRITELEKELTDVRVQLKNAKEALAQASNNGPVNGPDAPDTAEIEKLRRLAYTDVKTGVNNNNALNERLAKVDSRRIIFAITGICGMKHINDLYGKKAGDACIKNVAEKLSSKFGLEHVYRIIGDQFAMLFENNEVTYADVFGMISDIQKVLKEEDINITFGVADGVEYRTLGGVIEDVERQMKKFKDTEVNEGTRQWVQPKVETKEPEKVKVEPVSEEDLLAKALNLNT